jgi:mono/diheme cytochrome c family protein
METNRVSTLAIEVKKQMTRKCLRFLLPLLVMCAIVTALYAGGWAVITLNDLPDYSIAGRPLTLTFTVRQHGVTLLSNLQPSVKATAPAGLSAKAIAVPGVNPGEYQAALTLPQAGEWTITIDSGFNSSAVTLPPLKVIEAGSPTPTAFSPMTRGLRLFAAKGCVGCHRHVEVNPERTTDAKFDLTSRRFPPDYLAKFLADPSIKTAEMPNLHLKPAEIDALAAFINKFAKKQAAVEERRSQ